MTLYTHLTPNQARSIITYANQGWTAYKIAKFSKIMNKTNKYKKPKLPKTFEELLKRSANVSYHQKQKKKK